jgi:hypothetical protein
MSDARASIDRRCQLCGTVSHDASGSCRVCGSVLVRAMDAERLRPRPPRATLRQAVALPFLLVALVCGALVTAAPLVIVIQLVFGAALGEALVSWLGITALLLVVTVVSGGIGLLVGGDAL